MRCEDRPLALVLNVDSRRSRKRSADVLVQIDETICTVAEAPTSVIRQRHLIVAKHIEPTFSEVLSISEICVIPHLWITAGLLPRCISIAFVILAYKLLQDLRKHAIVSLLEPESPRSQGQRIGHGRWAALLQHPRRRLSAFRYGEAFSEPRFRDSSKMLARSAFRQSETLIREFQVSSNASNALALELHN